MKRHILRLAKPASLWTQKHIEIDGTTYSLALYTYYNSTGFVHHAILSINNEEVAHAKAQYINRTWERFTGASVYRQALDYAIKSKDITNWTKEEIFKSLDQSI